MRLKTLKINGQIRPKVNLHLLSNDRFQCSHRNDLHYFTHLTLPQHIQVPHKAKEIQSDTPVSILWHHNYKHYLQNHLQSMPVPR